MPHQSGYGGREFSELAPKEKKAARVHAAKGKKRKPMTAKAAMTNTNMGQQMTNAKMAQKAFGG